MIASGPVSHFVFVCALLAALASGCARQQPAVSAKPLSQAELDAMIKQKATTDPFLRSQVDFGLDAYQPAPDRVQVTLTNKTKAVVVVGPRCFGLIIPGRREVVKADAQSVKHFPTTKVHPGEQASGELLFTPGQIPPGSRLVFVAPERQGQPAMAPIRQTAAEPRP